MITRIATTIVTLLLIFASTCNPSNDARHLGAKSYGLFQLQQVVIIFQLHHVLHRRKAVATLRLISRRWWPLKKPADLAL